MNFNEYQQQAKEFGKYPKEGDKPELMYLALGLTGESGEIAEKIKKFYRDGSLDRDSLAKELGDVLWYLSQLSFHISWDLQAIAYKNIEKLSSRKERGVLGGSGDDR
jgi:NTP pyrophosphatase (non-canonical NTP hydrolase)